MRTSLPSAPKLHRAPKPGSSLQRKANRCGQCDTCQAPQSTAQALRSPGQAIDAPARALMESRFAHDFSAVRVHTGSHAARAADAIHARAYTLGNHVVFGSDRYAPSTQAGLRLLAHELAHVQQQAPVRSIPDRLQIGAADSPLERAADRASEQVVSGHSRSAAPALAHAPAAVGLVQRTLSDGHDLTSPRFSLLLDLEEAYDDESVLKRGSSGRGVQAIQQALYDLGFPLPATGADGAFGSETEAAVRAFQSAHPPLAVDGEVGPKTIAALDARFGAPALPPAADLAAPWSASCVRSVLCPWSPHTIDVLRSRITLKSFDSISWADEEWNGASWIAAPFPGGGYNTGTEIGVLNSSCETMAQTLYHEVLHAEQPSTHTTTRKRESYAYRIAEEFSIAMGLSGRSDLRSTDAQGRQFADRASVDTFVATTYPAVPAGGGGDEIIDKAATHGHVRVQRPDGTTYIRPALIGEKVPGPISLVGEATHPTTTWTC
jgi:hypothetical protein